MGTNEWLHNLWLLQRWLTNEQPIAYVLKGQWWKTGKEEKANEKISKKALRKGWRWDRIKRFAWPQDETVLLN